MRYLLLVLPLLAGCSSPQVRPSARQTTSAAMSIAKSAPTSTDKSMPLNRPEPPFRAQPEAKRYARSEFATLLVGKTQDQVKTLLGDPTSTGTDAGQTFWKYEHTTRDPMTGQDDPAALLWWKDGKVDRITYQTTPTSP